MPQLGRWRLLLRAGVATLVLLVPTRPTPVFAHVQVVESFPPDACAPRALPRPAPDDPRCVGGVVLDQPPTRVSARFSEPVESVAGGLRVLAPSGHRVELGPTRLVGRELEVDIGADEVGTYLVTWRVIAQDTHPARGSFAFSVGHASSPPADTWPATADVGAVSPPGLLLQTVGRWLHFVGYALAFGVLAFRDVLLGPLSLAGDRATGRRLGRLISAGVLLLVLAEPVALLAQVGSLGSGPGDLLDPETVSGALESSFGRVLAERLAAAALLWVLLGAAGPGDRLVTSAALLVGLTLAFVDGQAAHATAVRPAWVGLTMNALHVAAMGTWAGGLLGLLAVWRLPSVAGYRGAIAVRVGRLAAMSLAVLAASGTAMAAQQLTGPSDLLATAYGRTLAAKLGLLTVVLLMALAAVRVAEARRERWWRWEAAALASVMALAGLLVSLPPRT